MYVKEWCKVCPILNQKSISDVISSVCNKIFGLALTAYIDGLKTIVGWSSSDEPDDQGSRKSSRPWETALRLAEACQRQFEEPIVPVDLDGIEQRGIEALKKLTDRYSNFATDLT